MTNTVQIFNHKNPPHYNTEYVQCTLYSIVVTNELKFVIQKGYDHTDMRNPMGTTGNLTSVSGQYLDNDSG